MRQNASTAGCSARVSVVSDQWQPRHAVHACPSTAEPLTERLKGDDTTHTKSLDWTPVFRAQCGKGNLPHPSCVEERHILAANGALTGIHESPASTVARYEALIRVSEALRAYHDRDTLFPSLARELRPVVRFTFLGLGLYDEHTHGLNLRVLEATGNPSCHRNCRPRSRSPIGRSSIRHRSSSPMSKTRPDFQRPWRIFAPKPCARRVRCR